MNDATQSETTPGAVTLVRSRPLLANDFTFKTRLPNGIEVEMDALVAEEFCEQLERFADDCTNGCKRMRAAIRDAINTCTANAELGKKTTTELCTETTNTKKGDWYASPMETQPGADASGDTGGEAGSGSGSDTGSGSGSDTGSGYGSDTGSDTGGEAGSDTGGEAESDTGGEAESDTGGEAESE